MSNNYRTGKERFEFLFFKNDVNIICKKSFDVQNYNDNCRESLEMKIMMDNISRTNINSLGSMGIIPNFLKNRSMEDSWLNYKPYFSQSQDDILYLLNKTVRSTSFKFEIRENGQTIATSYLDGDIFSPSANWEINISSIIPEILSEIKYAFTRKSYTHNYSSVKLKRNNTCLKENKRLLKYKQSLLDFENNYN